MDINKLLQESPAYSARGANMGRPDYRGDPDRSYKFFMQRIRMHDYAYDAGGAYWGGPSNLYCAWVKDEEDGDVRVFVRAGSRNEAKTKVRGDYPNSAFYR